MFNKNKRFHRRSIRLPGFDYSNPGVFFVTICTHNRKCVFGQIEDRKSFLNTCGEIVYDCWNDIPGHFGNIELHQFVVMPNHIHGIINVTMAKAGRGTACRAPTVERFGKPVSGSIPTIIRSFKSAVTKRINGLNKTPGTGIWQRNYFEHFVRKESELERIRQYIIDNPKNWETDRNNIENLYM